MNHRYFLVTGHVICDIYYILLVSMCSQFPTAFPDLLAASVVALSRAMPIEPGAAMPVQAPCSKASCCVATSFFCEVLGLILR